MNQKIKFLTWIKTYYSDLFDVCFSNKRFDGTKMIVPENEPTSNTDFLSVVRAVTVFEGKIITANVALTVQQLQNLLVNEKGTEKFESELKLCSEKTSEYERQNNIFMKSLFFPALIRIFNDNASEEDIALIQERFIKYEKIRLANSNMLV